MDGNETNVNAETQQTDTTTATTATATEQQTTEATPEKVSALQKFIDGLFGKKADGDAAAEEKKDTAKEDADKGDSAKEAEKKTFSEEDVNSAIESARQKWLEEQKEAERISKLSPEEKEKEEQQKKDKELESLRGQLLQRDLKEQAVSALDKEGFPVKLAETLDYSSKENMEKSLKGTMDVFRDSLKVAIETRLKGKTPEGLGGAASAENMIKDQIAKNIRGGMM